MKKKIVVQVVRSPQGGIRKHVLQIIQGLDEFEHYLAIDDRKADQGFKDFLLNNPEMKERIFIARISTAPGVRDISNLFSLYCFFRRKGVHAVHGHGAKGGVYARLLAKLLHAKAIYTPHGGALHPMHGSLMNRAYSLIEKMLFFLSDYISFESNYSMSQYKKLIWKRSSKYILNRNGIEIHSINSAKKNQRDEKKGLVLGAFGLLRHIKGYDLLLKAGKLLIERGVRVQIRIFGEGEEKENLLRLARDLGIADRVTIATLVTDVEREMEQCHFVIQPSRFESFGYVPLEAMSYGVVALASNVGGLKEVVPKKYRFSKESPEAIAELVCGLKNNMPHPSSLKNYVRDEFSLEKMLDKYRDLYIK